MTPEGLIQLALARNADYLAALQGAVEARGKLLQAGLHPNPSLEVSAGSGAPLGSPGESEFTLGYLHVFETGGKREHRITSARLEVELAELSIANRARLLRAEIKARFGEALAAVRSLESTEHLLDLNEQMLGIAAARTRAGEGARLEEALVQVEVNRLKSDRLLFKAQVERALLELKTLAGMPLDGPLRLAEGQAPPRISLARTEALEQAVAKRADLAALKLEERLAEAAILTARSETIPNLVASARYSRVASRIGQYGYDSPGGALVRLRDTDHGIAGGITIALPVRDRNQGQIEAALARRQASRLRAQHLEQVVRSEVEIAYRRFESVNQALRLFETEVVKASEDNVSVIRAAYDLGELRIMDVITEQRRLVETQKAYTEILRESYLAATDLERAVGAPLF